MINRGRTARKADQNRHHPVVHRLRAHGLPVKLHGWLRTSHEQTLPSDRPSGRDPLDRPLARMELKGFSCLARADPGRRQKSSLVEVIAVWWQYIVIVALFALAIYGFVVLARYMTAQMSNKSDRKAEDMYDEFDPAHKKRDRWPI